jgi:uncharacterized membrane protein
VTRIVTEAPALSLTVITAVPKLMAVTVMVFAATLAVATVGLSELAVYGAAPPEIKILAASPGRRETLVSPIARLEVPLGTLAGFEIYSMSHSLSMILT